MSKLTNYLAFRRTAGQLPELDGLRGIAVILVLLRHAARPFWEPGESLIPVAGWDLGIFLINGWIGVDLFFVLSGFLITHHILSSRERNGGCWSWRPYLAKRALRIVPAYYAVLFLAGLGLFPYYDVGNDHLGFRLAYHMLFLQDYLPANIVVAFWSLGVEEKFYLIAPLLIIARAGSPTLREKISGVTLLLLLVIAARCLTAFTREGIDEYVAFFYVFRSPFHMSLDPILAGVVLAFVYRSRDKFTVATSRQVASAVFWFGAVLFALMTMSGAMLDSISLWDKTLQPTCIALAFTGMTYGLLFGGGPASFFRSTILFFFARISYSLYLVHLPLVPVSLLIAEKLTGTPNSFGTFLLIFCALSTTAALALHYLVEKPFLLIKDRVRPDSHSKPATLMKQNRLSVTAEP